MVDESVRSGPVRGSGAAALVADAGAQAAFVARLDEGATLRAAVAASGHGKDRWRAVRYRLPAVDAAWTRATGKPGAVPRASRAWSAASTEAFCDELGRTGDPAAAAELVGQSAAAAYRRRERDPKFAAAWELARARAIEGIEAVAFRRVLDPPTLQATLQTAGRVRDEKTGRWTTGAGGPGADEGADKLLLAMLQRWKARAPAAGAARPVYSARDTGRIAAAKQQIVAALKRPD